MAIKSALSRSCCHPADAQPTDAEREVWQQVDVVLKDAKGILDELQAYKGAGVEIREVCLLTVALRSCALEPFL